MSKDLLVHVEVYLNLDRTTYHYNKKTILRSFFIDEQKKQETDVIIVYRQNG